MQQHRLPAAGKLGGDAGLLHDRLRERAALGRDRERRERDHVGVAAQEEVLEEDLPREAGVRVVGAAIDLGQDRAEEGLAAVLGHQVVLEVVALDVEHELLAGKAGAGGGGLERRIRGHLPEPAERAQAGLAENRLQGCSYVCQVAAGAASSTRKT